MNNPKKEELLNCKRVLIKTLNSIRENDRIDPYLQEKFHNQYLTVCYELAKLDIENKA